MNKLQVCGGRGVGKEVCGSIRPVAHIAGAYPGFAPPQGRGEYKIKDSLIMLKDVFSHRDQSFLSLQSM